MSETNTGGPAFPVSAGHEVYSSGMTLRDWFAGQALAGMVEIAGRAPMEASDAGAHKNLANAARLAYAFADAMIAQSQKQEPHDA